MLSSVLKFKCYFCFHDILYTPTQAVLLKTSIVTQTYCYVKTGKFVVYSISSVAETGESASSFSSLMGSNQFIKQDPAYPTVNCRIDLDLSLAESRDRAPSFSIGK